MGGLIHQIRSIFCDRKQPDHLRKGMFGERAAERYLCQRGLKFLVRNYASKRGEIDLIFRQGQCMIFVEVKTRSHEKWSRPASAVNAHKRKLISQTA
ncbi:MAG: YraN family protein, partial [Verrucomicrobia bacterium]|nr:YraN family protein [Verrucomicrobiota bacterium]